MARFSITRRWHYCPNPNLSTGPTGPRYGGGGQYVGVAGQGGGGGGGSGHSTEIVDADSMSFEGGFLVLVKDDKVIRALTGEPGLEVKRLGS